jgi:response regulator RpfG family c-di-GMP phosphodiesterase
MNEINKATILIVDQRQESQNTLAALISREGTFEVRLENDWQKGLSVSKDIKPDAIICDGSIPWPHVLEFCQGLRECPDLISTVFILLGPPNSIEEKEKGLAAGIDDWIEKSVPSSLIIGKIKAWLRTRAVYEESRKKCEALQEKNDILQVNFKEMSVILVKTLDSYLFGINDRAKMAKSITEYISAQLNLDGEEKKKILFGVLLHEIGKVGLPQAIVAKDYHSLQIGEREVFSHHPAIGSMIISTVTGFKESANMIYHQLENFNGSGIPDALMGDEISVGARIMRAIVFQEELYRAGFSTEEVIEHIKLSLNKALDPTIADHLISFLEERDKSLLANKSRMSLEELKEGMTLAEDVYSVNGIKLLPKGVTMQGRMIKILNERNSVDPIIGGVYVFKDEAQG